MRYVSTRGGDQATFAEAISRGYARFERAQERCASAGRHVRARTDEWQLVPHARHTQHTHTKYTHTHRRDGGLYMPESVPDISLAELESWQV